MATVKKVFAQISKVNEEKRIVTGIATSETLDHDREIMDYETSKPLFKAWSEAAAARTGNKSFGNVRIMHQLKVGGHLEEPPVFDDASKAIYVSAHIDNDEAWGMVQSGSLSGFSISGPVDGTKWLDRATKAMRYTVRPTEVSLVDSPCNPGATFTAVKADGSEEQREFNHDPANDVVVKAGKKHSAGTMETVGKAKDALASMRDCLTNECDHESAGKCSENIMDSHAAATQALATFDAAETAPPAEKAAGTAPITEGEGDEMDEVAKAALAKATTDSEKAATDSAEALTIAKANATALESLAGSMTAMLEVFAGKQAEPVAAKSHSGAGVAVVTKTAETGGGEEKDAMTEALAIKDADARAVAVAKAVHAGGGKQLSRNEFIGLNIGR